MRFIQYCIIISFYELYDVVPYSLYITGNADLSELAILDIEPFTQKLERIEQVATISKLPPWLL